jgi:hypothetical protein
VPRRTPRHGHYADAPGTRHRARCLLALVKRINTGEVSFTADGVVERPPQAVAEAKEPHELAQAEREAEAAAAAAPGETQ